MRNQLLLFIDGSIKTILLIVIFLTPLFLLNVTTNYFDMPKLILLIISVVLILGLWIISWILKGKIVFVKTPLDIPFIILLLVILISTYLSTSKVQSVYGIFPEVHGSAVSWVTYILFYFVAVSHVKDKSYLRILLQAMLLGVSLLVLISTLSFFGIFLPFEIAKFIGFSPAGSTFSSVSLFLMLMPITLFSIVRSNKLIPVVIAIPASILVSLAIIFLGSIKDYLIFYSLFILTIYLTKSYLSSKSLTLILTPFALSIMVLMLSLLPFSGNKLQEIKLNFPKETQLPFSVSWKISASAFRDAPLLGTGPATFLYNFTNYKPVEFNGLTFWNISFGTAYNEFLQFLATLGILGFLTLASVCAVIVVYTFKYIFLKNTGDYGNEFQLILPPLALSLITGVLLLFLQSSTLVFVVYFFILSAIFMANREKMGEMEKEISLGGVLSFGGDRKFDILPVTIFILYLIGIVSFSGKFYKTVLADYYHRLALNQASTNGAKTYEYLQKAESLNPQIDLYRVDMAQTNFALANALALQKGPTKENPEGNLTDQDKQTIQSLVTQAINEGKASVVLAPRSARNWEVLAMIYRNITGVANNSLAFALDAYGRAIQLDPVNPLLRLNVGSIYYSVGNYEMAVRFFTDTVNLKPDYVNGYYNLAIALRDKGDLENARLVAQQAVNLLQSGTSLGGGQAIPEELRSLKTKDLNTAIELLNEIRSKLKDDQKVEEEGSALKNPNLPDINLPDVANPSE